MDTDEKEAPPRVRNWFVMSLPVVGVSLVIVVLAVFAVFRARSAAVTAAEQKPAETTEAAMSKKVFDSPLAGTWYVANKDKLSAEIDGYLAKVDIAPIENVHALILPHAGYRYSGQVAAFGVKQVAGRRFSRVIVMGPSHRVPMDRIAGVSDATHYATPLGEVPLDVDFIAALKKHPEFRVVRGTDEMEHSVQIQVPLLQRALGDFKLVPIVVGQLDEGTSRSMAKILNGLIDADTLVVASSDFTHYGDNFGYYPFRDDILANLKKLDMGAWDCIQKKDLEAFYGYIHKTGATICGEYPIGVLLAMAPPEFTPQLARYDTSGNITGDTSSSVSYLSAAFSGTWKKGEPVQAAVSKDIALTDDEKTQLLALARGTLEYFVKNGRMPTVEGLGITLTAGMNQNMGAFVTLKEKGELRGCIGEIYPRRALYKAVMEHAVNAGVRDYRFNPVDASELPLLHYEITAWPKDPEPIPSYKDFIIGKHGIVLEKNGRTALFLPQVAPEQGWDVEQTLTHLAMKAGLAPDAWKEGATFKVFEGIMFAEKER